jgi:Rps23 Pro-64 3,4-dihydroxylase Tpa1-like proline 4-hydroxylase
MWTNYEKLDAEQLRREFAAASPFPHVVLHDFLAGDTKALVDAFPDADWPGWTTEFRDRYQTNKRACDDLDAIPEPLQSVVLELQSPGFLEFLETVSGVEQIIPDPYLTGGGLHLSGPDGVLEPHSDFHLYPRLTLYRQINVLLYLNPEWHDDWGGRLELFGDSHARSSVRQVLPTLGTCVIFRTDDRSVHGFPEPVTDGHWRKSIATYYYTSTPRPDYVGDKYTYWRRHGEQQGVNKVRLQVHRGLVAAQRAVAAAAKAARPPEPKAIESPPQRSR